MKPFYITLFICFISVGLGAQFTMDGEFRPRAEYNHGTRSLANANQEGVLFIEQRSRLNFNFKNKDVKTKLVLQDIRVWGSQPQVNKTDGLTSVHEAWADIGLTDEWSMKLGRQEVFYDDERIFGRSRWAQQARSHDLALFKYENGIKFHLGIGHNASSTNLVSNLYTVPSYKNMQFLWLA